MLTTLPLQFLVQLPGVNYPEDLVSTAQLTLVKNHPSTMTVQIEQNWRVHNSLIGRNIRQYASSVGLNTIDNEHANVTSYSTRVERVIKNPLTQNWALTLRKMEILPYTAASSDRDASERKYQNDVRVSWWTEEFDAVVVASQGDADSPSTPPIPGLDTWANAFPDDVLHTQEYRVPEPFSGKVSVTSLHPSIPKRHMS